MSMNDLAKELIDSMTLPGNSVNGVMSGTLVPTEQGKKKMMEFVELAKKKALEFAAYSAEQVAAVATDLMITGINEGALQVSAGVPNQMGGLAQGMFKMQSSRDKIPFTLAEGGEGGVVFNPLAEGDLGGDPGAYGKFFESFFYGVTGNEVFPDLAQRGAMYGAIVEYLAPELKATGGSPVVGSKTAPPTAATIGAPTPITRMVTKNWSMAGYKGGETKGAYVARMKQEAKTKVAQSGFEAVITKQVDVLIQTAIGVIKILQKMAALMIIETQRATGNAMHNEGAKTVYFQFVSAMVYAKLNVAEIMRAAFPEAGQANPNNPFFRIDVTDKTQTVSVDKDGKGNYSVDVATIEVNMKSIGNVKMSGGVSAETYMDKYSLWKDEASRNAFFTAMYQLNRRNSMFAIAAVGSPQAAFNKQLQAAVGRMHSLK